MVIPIVTTPGMQTLTTPNELQDISSRRHINPDEYRYRRAYFTGWGSLEKEEQEALQKRYPELSNLSGRDKDIYLSNKIFNEVFENSTDKNDQLIFDTRKSIPKYERDRLFAQKAMSKDLDGLSNYSERRSIEDIDQLPFTDSLITDADLDALESHARDVGYENTTRGVSEQYLRSKTPAAAEKFKEQLNSMSSEELNKYLIDFDKASSELSSYYEKYNGTDKLSLSREDRINLLADYMANQELAGSEFANRVLSNYYQNTVANNQSFIEKVTNTANNFGNSAAGSLVVAAGMIVGLSKANILTGYNTDAEYWENVLDNGITRYGSRIAATGSYIPSEQKKLEERGMSVTPILNTVEQDRSTVTWNTPFELLGQYGFTAASTILSFGAAGAVSLGTKAATAATRLATAGRGLTAARNGVQMLNGIKKAKDISNVLVAGAVGSVEGGMNALQTKDEVQKSLMQQISEKAYQDILNNPSFGTTPEERSAKAAELASNEDFLKQHYSEDMNQIEEIANTAMYQDFWVNSAINGLTHSTLKATLHAPSVQKSLTKLGLRKNNLDDAFTISKGTKGWNAVAKRVTTKDVIKDRVKEVFGESIEEYSTELSSAFSQGYAKSAMQQYIDAKYNNGVVGNAVETDISEAFAAGMESVGNSALSRESIKSLLYGGLSTMLGGPNINQNAKKKGADESWGNYLMNHSPIAWRGAWTPLINHTERDKRNEQRKVQEKHLNDFFSDDEVQKALFNVEGTNNFLHEMEQALLNGDEKTARDARLAAMFSNLITLDRLKESGYYDAVMSSLQARASFNAENLNDPESAESKAVEDFIADAQNRDMEYTREEALEQIIKSSNEMLNLIDKVGKESTKVDKLFGKGLDPDVKASLVYNGITIDDNKERIQQLDEDLSKVTTAVNEDPTFSVSNANNDTKGLIVRFGSIENALKKKEAIEESIKTDEKALKDMESARKKEKSLEGKTLLNNMIRFVSSKLKKEKRDFEELSQIEETYKDKSLEVLTAADIMNLPASERSQMLNPKNRSKYSAEQQAEIDKLLGIGNSVFSDFSSKIIDRARLEEDYANSLQSQADMMSSSSALARYAYEAKKKVVDRAYAIKNQKLLGFENTDDYEGFSKEFESILNRGDNEEIRVVRDMLSSSKFYQRYMEEKEKKDAVRKFVNENKDIDISSEQANVFSVMQDFLAANGIEATSIDDAVAALSEEVADASIDATGNTTLTNRRLKLQDYIDKINESLPDDQKITISDFNSSISTFKDIMGKYNENVAEQARLSKKATPSKKTDPSSGNPNTSETIIDDTGSSKDNTNKDTKDRKKVIEYEEPVVNKTAKHNSKNIPVMDQAEFVVGRIRSAESRYGKEAVNTALKALENEVEEEFIDENDFETAINRAENLLIAASEEENSVEERAAAILKGAREEYQVHREKQLIAAKKKNDATKPSKKAPTRSLFQRGSDKYVDHLTVEERRIQEDRLEKILNGYGAISTYISPETDAVATDYFSKLSLINSVNVKAWWNNKRMPESLKRFWSTHKIEEYLISKTAQELKSKPVFFINPNIETENEQFEDYDYSIDSMLVAVVEDEEGQIIIGDKKYQPIALMPKSYDGVHNRYYHRDSAQGTAHLLNIRKNAANTPKGTIITDEKGVPIQTRITSFITGSAIATNIGYRPASQVNIDNFTGEDREEIQGKSKQEIRGTNAYKKAKKRFIDTFVSKGGLTKCFIRLFDNYGRPVGGQDGLVHVHINMTPEDFGKTVARNSDKTLEQVAAEVLSNEDSYSELYDSTVPYNEGGFNRRTQTIGKGLQDFFKNVFKLSEINSLNTDKEKIAKLKEYGNKLKEVFIQKYGVYFDPNRYNFLFIPSSDINGKQGYTLTLHDTFSDERFSLAEVTEGTMSDKTAAKVMANLFMYGGQIRHGFRWQIAPGEIGGFTERNGKVTPNDIAKEYVEELYDDGLVQTNKTRLSLEVNQVTIQSPFNREGVLINPQPIVTMTSENPTINDINSGTAVTTDGKEVLPDTGTSTDGSTIAEQKEREVNQEEKEAQRICEIIQEDSKGWSLTEDNTGYSHKGHPEVKHSRVTSVIIADETSELDENGNPKRFDSNSEWAIPSSLIGNSVDEFIRDFFDGKISDNFDFNSIPNALAEQWKTLYTQLKAFKDGFIKGSGLTIIPKDIIAHGTLEVTDENDRKGDLNVAGTLDLLAYDSNGNIYIFDMKTYRSSLNEKMEKYARQVSVYKTLIEQRLAEQGIDININSLSILPIKVNYPDARSYEYQQEEGSNQLLIKGKGEKNLHRFRGAKFTLGMPVEVKYKKPKIRYERLTEEEKSLVKWKDKDPNPVESTPPATKKSVTEDTKKSEDTKELSSEETSNTTKEEISDETPKPKTRRAVRGRGRTLNIGGVHDKNQDTKSLKPGDPTKSLSWLRANNPDGYKVALKFNENKKDNTAWDKLSDEVKDSYLSCLQ